MHYCLNLRSLLRKLKTFFFPTAISLISSSLPVFSNQNKKEPVELVENFKSFTSNLPTGWYASKKDVSMFSSETELNYHFLRVRAVGTCTSIGKQFNYSAAEYPFLSWKWRMHKLPEKGNESIKARNDSGAGIYVIFKGKLKLNTILKYVWSSTLPQGTQTTSPYNSRTRIIVLRDGTDTLNKWYCEKVNIYEDYQRIFGKKPPDIECIALLSDADNTASEAIADYGTIEIMDTM